jgi:perosamine synthetase
VSGPERARIPVADFRMSSQQLAPVIAVLRSGRLSEGRSVERFEAAWADYVGCRHCVAFSSGSTALLGGLLAARQTGLVQDGRILTSPSSYAGTVNAVSLAGFQPAFADIEPGSFGALDAGQVAAALRPTATGGHVAAVLPVHLFGLPANLPQLTELAAAAGIPVIEDAAQAHGSAAAGRRLGSFGAFGAFSFYMSHTVPGIEMGAVVTDDENLARQLRSVKDQGRRPAAEREPAEEFTAYSMGLNFKTSELSAAVALAHLDRIDDIIARRRRNAELLTHLLQAQTGALRLPAFPPGACPFAYPLVLTDPGIARDRFRSLLGERGIETRPLFPCIPTQQPAYRALREEYAGRLPHSEALGRDGLYVGCHEHLTAGDMRAIAGAVARILRKK